MLRRALLALFAFSLFPCGVYANEEITSGNKFYVTCQDKKRLPVCVGYIAGVADAYVWLEKDKKSCISRRLEDSDITADQLYDVVMKHLRDNPETRDQPAIQLIIKSMSSITGCPDRS